MHNPIIREIYEQVRWRPGRRDLRYFGWSLAAVLGILSLILSWRGHAQPEFGRIALPAAAVLALLGVVWPKALLWPYRTWMAVTAPVAFLVQRLLLTLFFYGVLTPVGILFRSCGRDPLQRRFAPDRKTYWRDYRQNRDKRRYFRQF